MRSKKLFQESPKFCYKKSRNSVQTLTDYFENEGSTRRCCDTNACTWVCH